jgi:FAD:protein FMN transferase
VTAAPRTVHVEPCMGTVFTIDIRDPGPWDGAVADAVGWLHHVDAVFSTYKEGSDISRLRRGELAVGDADPDVAPVLALCERLADETGGWFTAWWGAGLDPTGLVKGWAVERASERLLAQGSRNHAVNGGGDVQLAGEAAPGRPWSVGIADPFDRGHILATVSGRDLAVATSGTAERGAHILDPHAGAPARGLASASVVGPSLTRADAYATAAFARGPEALGWITAVPGYEALLVLPDARVVATPGLAA